MLPICTLDEFIMDIVCYYILHSLRDLQLLLFLMQIFMILHHSQIFLLSHQLLLLFTQLIFPCILRVAMLTSKFTIIESLVIPGSTKSYNSGVITFNLFVFLSFKTKNIFELPIYPTLPFHNQRTC